MVSRRSANQVLQLSNKLCETMLYCEYSNLNSKLLS